MRESLAARRDREGEKERKGTDTDSYFYSFLCRFKLTELYHTLTGRVRSSVTRESLGSKSQQRGENERERTNTDAHFYVFFASKFTDPPVHRLTVGVRSAVTMESLARTDENGKLKRRVKKRSELFTRRYF